MPFSRIMLRKNCTSLSSGEKCDTVRLMASEYARQGHSSANSHQERLKEKAQFPFD